MCKTKRPSIKSIINKSVTLSFFEMFMSIIRLNTNETLLFVSFKKNSLFFLNTEENIKIKTLFYFILSKICVCVCTCNIVIESKT